ncbi:MAG TPA: flagellar motor protein [Symbiobacteriaceae bacterium]|jgi:chemotaxis protein MotA|nr:flagellar motor protein [Symbiobacteriaceae bacterium]
MDIATIIGLVGALAAVLVGALLEGLHMSSLIGPTAFMIVVGGTVGATVMSHTMSDLKHLGGALKRTIKPQKLDYAGSINHLTNLAEKARRGGILALQEDVATAPHPILQTGLTMVVDGGDPDVVKEVLSSMVKMNEDELHHAAAVCDTAGGYCPTLGIMGTVLGLIHIMGNLDQPDTLGPAIAVAFLATFYGLAFANMMFLPLGSKIKLAAHQETLFGQMLIDGILGIQTGQNPRALKERLSVYMGSHGSKPKKESKGEKPA